MGSIGIIRFKLFLNDDIICVVSNKFNHEYYNKQRTTNKLLGGVLNESYCF